MSCPFSFQHLSFRVRSINGFELLNAGESNIYTAVSMVMEDYSDWPEEQGFGSSDMTYAVQSAIDDIIGILELGDKYKTDFIPYLSVVKK